MSKNLLKFAAAAGIYAGFAVYLYQPYFKHFNVLQYLLVANVCLASLGCFLLSRRWLVGFAGSFFAGAIYGFGPFMLGLAGYHPTAGLLAAFVPWLFCPAAFGAKDRWRWIAVPLSALPFLAILLFFQIAAHYRLFAVPIQARLHLADLAGLLAPLVMAKRSITLVGFYHIPIAALVMGFLMLLAPSEILRTGDTVQKRRFLTGLAARRFGIMIIFTVGTVLAFCDSFLKITPIIWLALPVLCCSVLVGVGIQALAGAGFADRGWVLMTAVIMGVLSVVTLLLAAKYFSVFAGLGAGFATLFVQTAKMYILGAIAVAIIFFIVRAKLRIGLLRLVLLCSAAAVDIFFSARFIVDRIL